MMTHQRIGLPVLFTKMFQTSFGSSQVRCEVQKFKFANKASNWLLEQQQPIKCSVYNPAFESHYELLNEVRKICVKN